MLLKLHIINSDSTVYVQSSAISCFYPCPNGTTVKLSDGNKFMLTESPEDIYKMIESKS